MTGSDTPGRSRSPIPRISSRLQPERILGFAALDVDAGEVMASVQIAMMAGLPYTTLRDAMLAHPTLVEGLIPLFSGKAEKIPAPQQISEVSNYLPDTAGSEISKFT